MRNLNDIMDFEHVIAVQGDGTVNETVHDVWAPECYVWERLGGDVPPESERLMIAEVRQQGWEPLWGYSAQMGGYHSPVMHASEFIGGRMEEDILSTPGIYTTVVVGILDSEDAYGWMVLRKEDGQ